MEPYPVIIHRPDSIPSMQILFLSEGYKEENEFLEHVNRIVGSFIGIEPFCFNSHTICIYAKFVKSQDDSIENKKKDTAFMLVVGKNGLLEMEDPRTIVSHISNIKVRIPYLSHTLGSVDASEIFLGRLCPEESLICILAKNSSPSTNTISSSLNPKPIGRSASLVLLSSWALTPSDSTPKYENPEEAVALTFAQQVGLCLGLASEKEQPGDDYAVYEETEQPDWPNVVSYQSLLDEELIPNIKQLKWKAFIPSQRQESGITEFNHPPSSSDTFLNEQFQKITEASVDSVIMLRHPSSSDDKNQQGPNNLRYLNPPIRPVLLAGDVHLFEGAAGFRQGLFRASSECLMRYEGYDIGTSSAMRRVGIDFCPICYEHLDRQLSGMHEFRLDGVRIIPGQRQLTTGIESRLSKAMVINCHETIKLEEYKNLVCVEATSRRFERLFKYKLRWSLFETVPSPNWNETTLDLPLLAGPRASKYHARRAWSIWNTQLKPKDAEGNPSPFALTQWMHNHKPSMQAMNFAGLGAAGAIVYLGFGSIANSAKERTIISKKWGKISFTEFSTIKNEDFEWIKPGAILQLWKDQDTYLGIKRYIAENGEDPDAYFLGHSLIYVGKENGLHKIADQTGIRALDDWNSFKFRICAQWFDATGYPLF